MDTLCNVGEKMISAPLQGRLMEEYQQDSFHKKREIMVISFDFGGTLAQLEKEEYLIYYDAFNELDFEVDINLLKKRLEENQNWWIKEKEQSGKIWNEKIRRIFLTRLFHLLNIDVDQSIILEFSKVVRYKTTFRVYDDVKPVLEKLRSEGYLLIVISNIASLEALIFYLTQTDLKRYFTLLVASGTVGFEKPNREIFLYASKTLQVPPSNFVHIGNDYEKDCLGALNAGINAIFLDRENRYSSSECKKISNLVEAISIINEFLRK